MSEKEFAQFSSTVNKLITGSQKLNEIINNTKSFGDEYGIGYDNGLSTSTMLASKFVIEITREPKLKSIIVTHKGKSVVKSNPISSSKVNT